MWLPVAEWSVIDLDDDDDLSSGTGEAFVIGAETIQVLVGRLGDFQALCEP